MPAGNTVAPEWAIKMRVAKEQDVFVVGGALEVHESTLKLSRKTFRMQIDSIYSDKIGAAPRELTSNAFDSHRRAGQDKPFFVHAPNAFDPTFWVRDYGTGMSDDLMKNVYIVIGESDKEDTDDEVGKWGLGSKSPFAYADQYTISCFDGAYARHYGYGINERGIPTLVLLHQEASEEPRGCKIGFSVEAKDFDTFQKSIERVSLAYEVPFESNLNLPSLGAPAFAGDGWKAYRDAPEQLRQAQQRWYARQGCVLYPLDPKYVTMPHESYNSSLVYIIDCPIGTIEVTPSRETIEYKDHVVEYLKARMEAVKTEIRDAIQTAVEGIPGVVEFFDTIDKIKPSYVTDPFVHPATGLTAPTLQAAWPTIFFKVSFSTHQRWEFMTEHSIVLKTAKKARYFVLDDVSPLLDPSRDKSTEKTLSRSELRRISRFVRAYLEKNDLREAYFIMNADWSETFREACFPDSAFVDVKFDALRNAVPKRVAPQGGDVKPPIRGLAIAKAAGEQKPVFEVKAEKGVAWVSSEQFRRQASPLFKAAKRFDITALYIAAPGAQHEMKTAGIPHFREAIDTWLGQHDVNFVDWYFAKEKLSTYGVRDFVDYLGRLQKHAPAWYDKLAAGKGEWSIIARTAKRMLKVISIVPIADDEKKAIESLITDDNGKVVPPTTPPDMVEFIAAAKVIDDGYNHPTVKFGKDPISGTNASALRRYTQALLSVQTQLPPSEKLKA